MNLEDLKKIKQETKERIEKALKRYEKQYKNKTLQEWIRERNNIKMYSEKIIKNCDELISILRRVQDIVRGLTYSTLLKSKCLGKFEDLHFTTESSSKSVIAKAVLDDVKIKVWKVRQDRREIYVYKIVLKKKLRLIMNIKVNLVEAMLNYDYKSALIGWRASDLTVNSKNFIVLNSPEVESHALVTWLVNGLVRKCLKLKVCVRRVSITKEGELKPEIELVFLNSSLIINAIGDVIFSKKKCIESITNVTSLMHYLAGDGVVKLRMRNKEGKKYSELHIGFACSSANIPTLAEALCRALNLSHNDIRMHEHGLAIVGHSRMRLLLDFRIELSKIPERLLNSKLLKLKTYFENVKSSKYATISNELITELVQHLKYVSYITLCRNGKSRTGIKMRIFFMDKNIRDYLYNKLKKQGFSVQVKGRYLESTNRNLADLVLPFVSKDKVRLCNSLSEEVLMNILRKP